MQAHANNGDHLTTPKILVVEDNEADLDMLSRRLQRKGYSVLTATSGHTGYLLACEETPDLILLDISLPGMDGWRVIDLLKGRGETRDIPIVVLTAHALVGDRAKAIVAGCADYHPKPINFDWLSARIDCLLLEKKPSMTLTVQPNPIESEKNGGHRDGTPFV
jgi:two-component system, cell cycle response regulator DivK